MVVQLFMWGGIDSFESPSLHLWIILIVVTPNFLQNTRLTQHVINVLITTFTPGGITSQLLKSGFVTVKGALPNFSLIPPIFFKQLEIFTPSEVFTCVLIVCKILSSKSTYFWRKMNFYASLYLSESTPINTRLPNSAPSAVILIITNKTCVLFTTTNCKFLRSFAAKNYVNGNQPHPQCTFPKMEYFFYFKGFVQNFLTDFSVLSHVGCDRWDYIQN